MPNYKLIAQDLWNRFGKLGKALTVVAGVVAAYSTIHPVIVSTIDKTHKIWTTQTRIDKLQGEVDSLKNQKLNKRFKKLNKEVKALTEKVHKLESLSKDKQEYILVLDGIIDGVLETHYHRGVRFGRTIKGDVYYHTKDCDHIKKWMRAIYTAEKDEYGYIDHNGDYNLIEPKKPSKIMNK